MSAAARARAAAKDPFERSQCGCGAAVVVLDVEGSATPVDPDRDDAGDVHATRRGGRWTFTAAARATGPGFRYRRHRCARTQQAELRRLLDRDDYSGPCRTRGCTGRAPNLYGPNFNPFCLACQRKQTGSVDHDPATR